MAPGTRLKLPLGAARDTEWRGWVPWVHSLHHYLVLLALHHVICKHSVEVRDRGC